MVWRVWRGKCLGTPGPTFKGNEMIGSESKHWQDLSSLLDAGGYVLFAGAGVSVEAGLPSWKTALYELADALTPHSSARASVMREEIGQNRLLHAAEEFYLALMTPEDRAGILREVFGKPVRVTQRLRKLVKQPFHSVITTNYDQALIEANNMESGKLLQFTEFDLPDARVSRERYILRIHGRIEVPSSIVLSREHYQVMLQNKQYKHFVQTLITDASVIFFGFSFADSYFRTILEQIREATNGRMKKKSFALLAGSPEPALQDLLITLNVVPVSYNPENNHEEAWDLITRERIVSQSTDHYSESRLRQHLASILTHLRLQRQSDLYTAVLSAATEVSIEHNGGGTVSEVVEAVRLDLALSSAASDAIRNVIADLIASKRLRIEDGQIVLEKISLSVEETPAKNLDRLVSGVLARAQTRYGRSLDKHFDYTPHIREVFLRILVADGMLLAHSLIRRTRREVEQVDSLVERSVAALETSNRHRIEPLREAIKAILTRPEIDEEEALDELASIAFVMCLTLTDPGVPAIGEKIAQHSVFLDASVVLPWISQGHPSQAFYAAIVENVGSPAIADFYVNEIVAHRSLAIREFEEMELHKESNLRRFSLFFGLSHVNTFIAGYGGYYRNKSEISFEKYLEDTAPFESEKEAIVYLKRRGIRVHTLQVEQANLPHMRSLLRDKLKELNRGRNPIPIEHDAKMIGYLSEKKIAARPYFITADRSLVAAFGESSYAQVVEHIVFPHQAFAIAQTKSKSRGAVRGLARTVFGMGRDVVQEMKEFYIDRVLDEYEPAMIEAIPTMIEEIVSQGNYLLTDNTFGMDSEETIISKKSLFTKLDQFEAKFHETMLKEKEKIEKRAENRDSV